MRSETESEFVAHRLHNVRRRFAAEETLDDRRAMEIIAEEVFGDEESGNFDDETADRIIQKIFLKTRRRLGILQPLLEDRQVTEIMVNGPKHIFAERQGKIERWSLSFDSPDELVEIIRNIAGDVHREISELNPIVDARLADGSRVNSVYSNVAINGPILTIRKFSDNYMTMEDLAGNGTVTPEAAARFNLEGDERNTMVLQGTVHVYDPETLLPTDQICKDRNGNPLVLETNIKLVKQSSELDVGDNVEGWRQGARSVKWFVSNEDFKNGRNQSNDIPLIRYADILMMKAEAIARGASATGGDTSLSLFNQIRSYVHAPELDHAPSLDEIYEERGREFFDENLRRMDMIRFGHFEDEYCFHKKGFENANFDKTHRIFPLHKGNQLDTNPKWKQNPGY